MKHDWDIRGPFASSKAMAEQYALHEQSKAVRVLAAGTHFVDWLLLFALVLGYTVLMTTWVHLGPWLSMGLGASVSVVGFALLDRVRHLLRWLLLASAVGLLIANFLGG